MLRTLVSVALLTASSALYAQAAPPASVPRQRFDCSKAADPKACEERLGKAKAAHAKARKACEGRKGDDQRDCMRREMCAQTSDPAKCEANVKQRAAERARLRETCKGKKGDELRACVRENRKK